MFEILDCFAIIIGYDFPLGSSPDDIIPHTKMTLAENKIYDINRKFWFASLVVYRQRRSGPTRAGLLEQN